jgi:hypothetical protein
MAVGSVRIFDQSVTRRSLSARASGLLMAILYQLRLVQLDHAQFPIPGYALAPAGASTDSGPRRYGCPRMGYFPGSMRSLAKERPIGN